MPFTTFALDFINQNLIQTIVSASLHTDYSSTGLNEVAGGTPAYVRQPVTFTYLRPGAIQSAPGVVINFDVPPFTQVSWVGFWDIMGTFLGMFPYTPAFLKWYVVDDIIANILYSSAPGGHGLVDGDTVVTWRAFYNLIPSGVTYFVLNPTLSTTSLQLSATLGGPPLTFSLVGGGFLQKIVPTALLPSQSVLPFPLPGTQFVIDSTLGR